MKRQLGNTQQMNNMCSPRISIIIPAYNAEAFLERCIKNVLLQTVSDWELLIVDDGSEDSTGQIAEAYAELDERIKVFHTENRGASSARNLGMENAKGDYISFVDADDTIDPSFYESLLILADESDADISQCSFSYVYDDVMDIPDKTGTTGVFRGKEDIERAYFAGSIGKINICIWNKLFSRKLLGEIRFDEKLNIYEDAFFVYNCCKKASCIACTSKVLYHYHQHPGSVMNSVDPDGWTDYFTVFERELADYRKDSDIRTMILTREAETALYLIHRLINKDRNVLKALRSRAVDHFGQMVFKRTVQPRLKAKMFLLKMSPGLYYKCLRMEEYDVSFPLADPNVRQRAWADLLFSFVFSSAACLLLKLFCQLSIFEVFIIWVIFFAALIPVYYLLWSRTDLIKNIRYICYRIVNSGKKKNVFCPCCGHEFVKFRENAYFRDARRFNWDRFKNARQDVVCPFCGSLPRHRIIAEWCGKNSDELSHSRNLYFACESSMKRWFRKNRIKVTTADLFSQADLKLDITDIDLPDGSFDHVFSNHVLEHVPDYKKALGELRRILVPGGKLIVSFPIDLSLKTVYERTDLTADERVRLFGQFDHYRLFGSDSRRILEDAGFSVCTVNISELSENILPVVGPSDYDSNMVFICTNGASAGKSS